MAIFTAAKVASGERIHFERNTRTTAEVAKHHRLLQHRLNAGTHGTRPVNEHHQSVILTLWQNRVAAKDIFRPLVVHHANGIKNTRVANRSALGNHCCFAKFELLGELIDIVLALDIERILHSIVCFANSTVSEERWTILLHELHALLVIEHNLGEIAMNQLRWRIDRLTVSTMLLHALLERLLKLLLRDRRRCLIGRTIRIRTSAILGWFVLLLLLGTLFALLALLVTFTCGLLISTFGRIALLGFGLV